MIYLDNAATTKPSDAAVRALCECMEDFGNPSSLHGLGLSAEKRIKYAVDAFARILGVDKRNIFFTSGGTESDNTAIFGAVRAMQKRGRHIITTSIEHPAVIEAMRELERGGFEVTYLNPDKSGSVPIESVSKAARRDTILVSMMHVNNETGAVQPVDKLRAAIKNTAPNALIHSDAVQSFGKLDVKPKAWGIDMISVSGHKFHAPKGVGLLYSANPAVRPLMYGGGQQRGMRPGTENVAGIYSMARAAEEIDIKAVPDKLKTLRAKLKSEIEERIDNVSFNGDDETNAGSVLNVSFAGIRAEILLHAMEAHGIYISTGSACSSNKPQPSHVLTAMGCSAADIQGSVRFSFCMSNTIEEMEETAAALEKEVAAIRKVVR